MRPVHREEILDLKSYESVREQLRTAALAEKEPRRVALGPNMTLLFENRVTVRYQVQEMLRVERISGEPEIRHELQTYNELVPSQGELVATLLIEYPEAGERDRQLRSLVGFEGALVLKVGAKFDVRAQFDDRQIGSDRLSSVHYIRFGLGAAASAFRAEGLSGGVRVVAAHPAYSHEAILKPAQVMALAVDLEAPNA
jgi:hypothetical protein